MIKDLQSARSKLCSSIMVGLALAHLVQGVPSPFALDRLLDSSYDPTYLEKFLEPDSEEYRNISVCPELWHVKETLAVLKMWGYPGEEYTITTEDGYIMSLFRILPKTPRPFYQKPKPILFLHGFLAAPELFLLTGENDLALMLTNAGYDVWLATYRGEYYGRRHVNLTTQDKQFWEFTFHESAVYDIPTMIDHILRVTQAPRVSCIGHSMGNAIFMGMLAMKPEYNDKVQLFVGLAPYAIAQMDFSPEFQKYIIKLVELLRVNQRQYKEKTDLLRRRKMPAFMGVCWSMPRVCFQFTEFFMGRSVYGPNWNTLPVLLAYCPGGSNTRTLEHLFTMRNGTFQPWDYGPEGNLAHYNTSRAPPAYDLTNVKVPVALYYGETDKLVSLKGMKAQVKALPNVVRAFIVPGFNHLDFLNGRKVRERLNNHILDDFRKYH